MTTDLDLIALDTSDRFVFDAHNAFLTARMIPIDHHVRMDWTNGDIDPAPERRREIALLARKAADTLRTRLPRTSRITPCTHDPRDSPSPPGPPG